MRGTEATKRIRDMGFAGIILGVTGNVLDDDIKEFKMHGADEVLPKPFELEAFKSILIRARQSASA